MTRGFAILPNILQRGVWVPVRAAFAFFLRLEIRGGRMLQELPRGVIFAVNHGSELDSVILPASLGILSRHLPIFYVARERKFYAHSGWRQSFYGGAFFNVWGAYPVLSGKENYEVALAHHIEFLEGDQSLCIFPEGKVTETGKLGTGKGGVTYLSWRTGKPIVPVAISGTWRMGIRDFFLRKRRVSISFGAPIYPRELFAYCNGNPAIAEEQNDFSFTAQTVMHAIADLSTHPTVL